MTVAIQGWQAPHLLMATTAQAPATEPTPRRHEGLWWGGVAAIAIALLVAWQLRRRRSRSTRRPPPQGGGDHAA